MAKDKEEKLIATEEVEDEVPVVVITDEEGNETYFSEERVIPIGKKNFALLVPLEDCDCEDEECACHHHDDGEVSVFIARMEFDEDGEPIYLEPTEEEYRAVTEAYNKMMDEEEE